MHHESKQYRNNSIPGHRHAAVVYLVRREHMRRIILIRHSIPETGGVRKCIGSGSDYDRVILRLHSEQEENIDSKLTKEEA